MTVSALGVQHSVCVRMSGCSEFSTWAACMAQVSVDCHLLRLRVSHQGVYTPHSAHVPVSACGFMCCCYWCSMHGTSVSVWSCLVALCFASDDGQELLVNVPR